MWGRHQNLVSCSIYTRNPWYAGLGLHPPVIPHWGSQLRHQWAGPGTTPFLTSISRGTDRTVRVIGIEPVCAGEHEWAR